MVLGFLEGLVALGAEEVVMVGKTLTGLSPLLEPNTQITALGSHLPAETSHHTHFPVFFKSEKTETWPGASSVLGGSLDNEQSQAGQWK